VIVGVALTVTIAVVVQPLLFVYVIVLVPAPTPVTNPVVPFIVATVPSLEVQAVGAAGVAEPVKPVVPPTHTVKPPVIIGDTLIVTIAVVTQPLLFV